MKTDLPVAIGSGRTSIVMGEYVNAPPAKLGNV
jgi:hypothetical protein